MAKNRPRVACPDTDPIGDVAAILERLESSSTATQKRLSRLEVRSEESSKAGLWEKAREWGALGTAVLALVLAVLGFYQGLSNAKTARAIEVNRLLDQAWDLLGGKPGSTTITDYVEDRAEQERARRLIAEAFLKDPKSPEAHWLQAAYQHAQGKLEEAERSYRRALELDPDYAEAYHNLGNVLAYQGKLEEAEASYRRVRRLTPGCRASCQSKDTG